MEAALLNADLLPLFYTNVEISSVTLLYARDHLPAVHMRKHKQNFPGKKHVLVVVVVIITWTRMTCK